MKPPLIDIPATLIGLRLGFLFAAVLMFAWVVTGGAPRETSAGASPLYGVATFIQAAAAVAFWVVLPRGAETGVQRDRRLFAWVALRAWYYVAAVLASGLAASLIAAGYHVVFGLLIAIGGYALAATADFALTSWESEKAPRGDVAVFIAGTHMLGLLVIIAFWVEAAGGRTDDLTGGLQSDGFVGLTLLALPVCAGIWVRLRLAGALSRSPRTPAIVAELRWFSIVGVMLLCGVLARASQHG